MRLQSAIFDMDGTLLDSMYIWKDLGARVLVDLGVRPRPDLYEHLKVLSLREGAAYCKKAYHLQQTQEELVELIESQIRDFYYHEVQAKPGVQKFLSLLKMEGVWMYVATATNRPLVQTALRAAGMKTAVVSNKPDKAVAKLAEDYFPRAFDIAVGERDGVRRKPAPDAVLEVMKRLGATAEETVYIGDSDVDCATAANAGTDFIGVCWGFRPREVLEESGAKVVCAAADELLALILGSER